MTDILNPYFKIVAHDRRDVEWGVYRFPDGQIQFWIEDPDGYFSGLHQTNLICSLPDPECVDIFFQMLSTLSLNYVKINYLYGARCDKERGGSRSVAHLPSTILQRLPFGPIYPSYTILAPHCDEYVKGFAKTHGNRVATDWSIHPTVVSQGYEAICFPDESAYRRFGHVVNNEGQTLYIGQKHRDQKTGGIESLVLTEINPLQGAPGRILVIDDLCDGGSTFLKVAKLLPPGSSLDLCVTHGVFSSGAIERLMESYGNVYCSNSLPQHNSAHPSRLHVWDVWQ